jgi:hypothetical protein
MYRNVSCDLFLYCVSERVFDAADGILNLALRLIGLSFGFQLGITYHFAECLFDCALDLFH